MKKSVSSFVTSLIFSLIGIGCSYLFWAVILLVTLALKGPTQTVCNSFSIINLVILAMTFIGSFFYLWRAKIASIIMTILSLLSLTCLIIISIALKSFEFFILLFWFPSILILIIALLGFKKKNNINETTNQK